MCAATNQPRTQAPPHVLRGEEPGYDTTTNLVPAVFCTSSGPWSFFSLQSALLLGNIKTCIRLQYLTKIVSMSAFPHVSRCFHCSPLPYSSRFSSSIEKSNYLTPDLMTPYNFVPTVLCFGLCTCTQKYAYWKQSELKETRQSIN